MGDGDAEYLVETYSNADIPPGDIREWMDSHLNSLTYPAEREYPEGLRVRIDHMKTPRHRLVDGRQLWTPGGTQGLTRTLRHIKTDQNDNYRLMIPLDSGEGIRHRNDRSDESGVITPGSAILMPVSDPMRMEVGGPEHTIIIEFPRAEIQRFTNRSSPVTAQIGLSTGMGRAAMGMIDIIMSQRHDLRPPEFDLLCRQIAEIICMAVVGDDRPPPAPTVETVIRDYVRRHAGNPDLSSRSIARDLGWSLRHLERIMSQGGTTPSDIIRMVRMSLALDRLQDPANESLSIDDIARGVGFSPGYFRREFRRHYGITPRDARRTRRLGLRAWLLRGGRGWVIRVLRRRRRRRRSARVRGALVLEEAPRFDAEGVRDTGHLVDGEGGQSVLGAIDRFPVEPGSLAEAFLGEAAGQA